MLLTKKDVRDLSSIVADANIRHCCGNCGGAVFATNATSGDVYCIACGGVDERLLVDAATFDELFDAYGNLRQFRPKGEVYHAGEHREDVGASSNVRSSNSAPYRRATYWAERISQVTLLYAQVALLCRAARTPPTRMSHEDVCARLVHRNLCLPATRSCDLHAFRLERLADCHHELLFLLDVHF